MNKELEDLQRDAHPTPPLSHVEMGHQQFPSSPPPPPLPQFFPSYPVELRRSGVYIPIPLFILVVLVFFFESSILFVYTTVALYKTVPAAFIPFGVSGSGCNGAALADRPSPMSVSLGNLCDRILLCSQSQASTQDASTIVSTVDRPITVTVMTTFSNPQPTAADSSTSPRSDLSSSSVVLNSASSSDSAMAAILSDLAHISTTMATVTAAAPTVTVLSTASSLPQITTVTVLSTASPARPTVTSIAFVTGS